MRATLLLIFAFLSSACTTTDAVRINESKQYAPSEAVEILSEPPEQPYEVISMLESRGSVGQSLPALLKSMRERAREMGADAIIPTQERSEHREPGFIYNALIGGYQSLPGGRVPILRGYAIIYERNKERRASAFTSRLISGGIAANGLPVALGGYGAELWVGKGHFRAVGEIYSLQTPNAFLRDGFQDGEIDVAYRLTGNYFPIRRLEGFYATTGFEYAIYSVGYERTTARGEWESFFASAGVGYLLRLNRYLHLDARVAVNARLTGENEVEVGRVVFKPDPVTPAGFLGLGLNL